MFIAALFTIVKIWKRPTCPSTDEWIDTRTHNGILAIKKKKYEILPSATTWIDLEGIMLSEVSQTEKDKYCMLSLICGI